MEKTKEGKGNGNPRGREGCMEFLDYEVEGTTLPFRGREVQPLSLIFEQESLCLR